VAGWARDVLRVGGQFVGRGRVVGWLGAEQYISKCKEVGTSLFSTLNV
jgi:hypothetical protein